MCGGVGGGRGGGGWGGWNGAVGGYICDFGPPNNSDFRLALFALGGYLNPAWPPRSSPFHYLYLVIGLVKHGSSRRCIKLRVHQVGSGKQWGRRGDGRRIW